VAASLVQPDDGIRHATVTGVQPCLLPICHGLLSRAGILPLSRQIDHVGAFARSLADLALVLDVIAGHDPADADTQPFASADFRRSEERRVGKVSSARSRAGTDMIHIVTRG